MDEIERQRERRRLRALERLETDKPSCVVCGENNPHCLERHISRDRLMARTQFPFAATAIASLAINKKIIRKQAVPIRWSASHGFS